MARAQTCSIVTVEVFIKEDMVPEMRITLEFLSAAKYRSPALLVPQEKAGEPPGQVRSHIGTVHHDARTLGTFHLHLIAEIVMIPLERFDHQKVHRKPDRPAPIGVAAEYSSGRLGRLVI